MFAHRPRYECRKKPKPASPGAPPVKKTNQNPAKQKIRQNSLPVNHSNKVRQHYTRVQRG